MHYRLSRSKKEKKRATSTPSCQGLYYILVQLIITISSPQLNSNCPFLLTYHRQQATISRVSDVEKTRYISLTKMIICLFIDAFLTPCYLAKLYLLFFFLSSRLLKNDAYTHPDKTHCLDEKRKSKFSPSISQKQLRLHYPRRKCFSKTLSHHLFLSNSCFYV